MENVVPLAMTQVDWKNYIINAGLPVEMFDVGFDVEQLKEKNIPLISQMVD